MRGISVVQEKSQPLATAKKSSIVPCFVGSAPIWQVDREDWQDLAGKAYLINSTEEMKKQVGFMDPEEGAWKKEASLCCAAKYVLGVVLTAPVVIVVNAQAIPQESETQKKTVNFVDGKAEIEDAYVITNSVTIEGKEKGVDFTVNYDGTGKILSITALTEIESAEVNYKKVKAESLKFSPDTFKEFDFFEQSVGVVPTTFGCPLWESETMESSDQTVGQKLMEVLQNPLNSHWYGQGYIGLSADTITEAKEEKTSYKNYKIKSCWPYINKEGRIYPMSVVYMAIKAAVDAGADGIPYISASNEIIDMEYLCTKDGARVRLTEADATGMNDVGIATANFSDMQWVTWGVCMSNYDESTKDRIAPDQLNDVAVQMKDFVSNRFQTMFARQLDKPMPKRQANDIVQTFQSYLDSLVTIGALIYAKVEFLASENSTAALADGEFTFTISETNTPPGKAIIGRVAYNADALKTMFE